MYSSKGSWLEKNNISFVLNGLIYKGMHYSFKIIQTLSKLGIPDLTLSKYIALTIFVPFFQIIIKWVEIYFKAKVILYIHYNIFYKFIII